MRTKILDKNLMSNIDLTKFSNARLKIVEVESDHPELRAFNFKSTFKVWSCNKAFAMRYLMKLCEDKGLKISYLLGVCSDPSAIVFN